MNGRRRPLGAALIAACTGLAGCSMFESGDRAEERASLTMPLPSYTVVVEQYNKRVDKLDKVWARVSMRVTGKDNNGQPIDEQAEGHLQVVRPDKLALSITKIGETYFYLGSNEKLYWWLDLHEEHTALVGRHDRATPQLAARFNVPVHPLDLLDLLGVMPLPPGAAATTHWTADGRSLEVVLPGRWGKRRMELDPRTYQPRRIELLDAKGKIVVSADLDSPQPVLIRCDGATPPMASEYRIDLRAAGTKIVLRLYDPENRCDRQKLTPFDFEALRSAYGVTRVEWIDEKPAGKAAK